MTPSCPLGGRHGRVEGPAGRAVRPLARRIRDTEDVPDSIHRILAEPPDLPVVARLGDVGEALAARGLVVVHAPPGTGKTTMVPVSVAADVAGRIVVTQPSRIAVRAAARRLAGLLEEDLGETVGYAVRGERRVGVDTRIEFVTTGLLLRRLHQDPELPGVGGVILDEVHGRDLDADLTMALLLDVRETLREELRLVAMSATVEAGRTAELLGGADPAPVVGVPGALHPVAESWHPLPAGRRRTDERGITPAFLDHVAHTVRHGLDMYEGDVLVFLPGVAEVEATARRLAGVDADVHPLHGRLSGAAQDRALSQGPRRRVVVSTAVAESSLTVPGVRVVVDAGFSREARTDHRRGLAGLVTVAVSRAAAEQRAGRAGRLGPGVVLRCWSVADHVHLPSHPQPEILTADLTAFALEVARWGAPEARGLSLLDPPPAHALASARDVLAGLGALDAAGRITNRGRAMADVPTDPRLARALLDGAPLVGARRAAEVVAMLTEEARPPGGDLVAALRALRRGGAGDRWRAQVRRLERAIGPGERSTWPSELTDDLAVGLVVALAHPGRIARRRSSGSWLMAGGTGAVVDPREPGSLAGLDWLAVADADRRTGARDATIRAAAPLTEDLALEVAPGLWHEVEEVSWSGGRVAAVRRTRFGAIELSTSPIGDPPMELVARAVRAGLAADGLEILPWTDTARSLRARLDFLHRTVGEPWPDVSDDALAVDPETWLGPDLARVRGSRDLSRIDMVAALRRLVPWPEAGRLDELAPEHVMVPTGSRVRVDYAPDQPVLAVRLQEVFGWTAPALAEGRVPLLLHLLSPARRPVAVTGDLDSFWDTGYPQVRAEMRGRYPKHPWPEDPRAAPPTRRTKRAEG